jgi:HSP20 family protein
MRLVRYTQPNARSLVPSLGLLSRSPWTGLETEIDRWFESVFDGIDGGTRFPVDLYEDKDNAYVRADLPGVAKGDINVEMVDGYLTIAATRKQKSSDGAEESVSFTRSVSIPEDVHPDKVAAAYENGVLTVTLPKREEAKPRKVAVEVK